MKPLIQTKNTLNQIIRQEIGITRRNKIKKAAKSTLAAS